jgi:putative Mg2+ transporter-C (MgtC) family protein
MIDLHSYGAQVAIKMLLAVLAGGVIGLERELKRKPAGLRTNILICVSAALVMIISRHISGGAPYSDPARLVAQIVVGVGFIGAGVIMRSRGAVTGLTTAATILAVTAIGVGIGDGMYGTAIGVTTLIVVVLVLLGYVERAIIRRRRLFHFELKTDKPEVVHTQLLDLLEREKLHVADFNVREVSSGLHAIGISVVTSTEGSHKLMQKLRHIADEVKASSFDSN